MWFHDALLSMEDITWTWSMLFLDALLSMQHLTWKWSMWFFMCRLVCCTWPEYEAWGVIMCNFICSIWPEHEACGFKMYCQVCSTLPEHEAHDFMMYYLVSRTLPEHDKCSFMMHCLVQHLIWTRSMWLHVKCVWNSLLMCTKCNALCNLCIHHQYLVLSCKFVSFCHMTFRDEDIAWSIYVRNVKIMQDYPKSPENLPWYILDYTCIILGLFHQWI